MRVLIIHGPNLELLGQREPGVYGEQTLAEINAATAALGRELNVDVDAVQFNEEEDKIAAVGAAATQRYDGIIINSAAYTHTSPALGRALGGLEALLQLRDALRYAVPIFVFVNRLDGSLFDCVGYRKVGLAN